MSTPIYSDKDIDLSILQTKRLAFIGYGNQGAAQSQNLRDSGVIEILIGNRNDAYKDAAIADDFQVVSIAEAAAWGDVIFLLIPDEVQPQVFREQIAPYLKAGATLVVASGYNVAFQLFDLPNSIDVIMVAPRMIGSGVRQRYLSGEPYPCFISVERDTSGNALKLAHSIAHGIGATRGAILSSAREEAALDLFSEQAIWPFIMAAFRTAYQVLHEAGFSDGAILNEMYLSKEPAEVFDRIATRAFSDNSRSTPIPASLDNCALCLLTMVPGCTKSSNVFWRMIFYRDVLRKNGLMFGPEGWSIWSRCGLLHWQVIWRKQTNE